MDWKDPSKARTSVRSPGFQYLLAAEIRVSDMLTLNQPPLTQHISIPKDMSQLSCEAFTAGIVEGVLDGLDVVCHHWGAKQHDLILALAGKGHRAYGGDRSTSPTDGSFDQVGSESHGSRRDFGKVRKWTLERLGLDSTCMTNRLNSMSCSVCPSLPQLGKEGLNILLANCVASFRMNREHRLESIPNVHQCDQCDRDRKDRLHGLKPV